MIRFVCLVLLLSSPVAVADDQANPAEATKLLANANQAYEKRDYVRAVELATESLKLDPKMAAAYDLRGTCRFMSGRFKESVADFDVQLKLDPAKANGHWRRGIALYYVGKYKEGKKQFQGYEKVDTNDVENSVWHLMCAARAGTLAEARKHMS